MMSRYGALVLALIGSVVLVGCVTPRRAASGKPVAPTIVYEHGRWSDLPGWDTDTVKEAWQPFLESCRASRFRAEWTTACTAALTIVSDSSVAIRQYFESYFEPYKIVKRTGAMREDTGLITGYFEPLLHGSRTASARFATPLYAPPPDLLTVDL